MIAATVPPLQAALETLCCPGVLIGHRIISVGDEHALTPEEVPAFAASVLKVRRASGAARIVARELLARIGHAGRALPKARSGAPLWPPEIVGSLAHDSEIALAAVGLRRDIRALGIDIEPAEALPRELLEMVATPRERLYLGTDHHAGRLLFVAKEAVYKALHPIDNMFLEHHDVEIDFAAGKAMARTGWIVELRFCVSTHLVALAFLP
jgi:4'-phosphopantetheinyl transferase EntD